MSQILIDSSQNLIMQINNKLVIINQHSNKISISSVSKDKKRKKRWMRRGTATWHENTETGKDKKSGNP